MEEPEIIDISGKDLKFHTKVKSFRPNKQVAIRFLSDQAPLVDFRDGSFLPQEEGVKKIEKAIIHFHGGGFICQDSGCHQNYTRKWANDLSIPVFSVDYRLAPKNPYPDPVNDAYQAYVWIATQAKTQLGLDIK